MLTEFNLVTTFIRDLTEQFSNHLDIDLTDTARGTNAATLATLGHATYIATSMLDEIHSQFTRGFISPTKGIMDQIFSDPNGLRYDITKMRIAMSNNPPDEQIAEFLDSVNHKIPEVNKTELTDRVDMMTRGIMNADVRDQFAGDSDAEWLPQYYICVDYDVYIRASCRNAVNPDVATTFNVILDRTLRSPVATDEEHLEAMDQHLSTTPYISGRLYIPITVYQNYDLIAADYAQYHAAQVDKHITTMLSSLEDDFDEMVETAEELNRVLSTSSERTSDFDLEQLTEEQAAALSLYNSTTGVVH